MTVTFPDGTSVVLDVFGMTCISWVMLFVMLVLHNAVEALRDVWTVWLKERQRND
jgi:hypothetical protein